MKKKKLKCYIYIRVSTSMQVEGYSLEAQRERLTKFADFQDIEIVREYCDAGKSGKNITGRPEFSQMLNDVAEDRDGVDFILVFKLVFRIFYQRAVFYLIYVFVCFHYFSF